jgi:hypothetical protein
VVGPSHLQLALPASQTHAHATIVLRAHTASGRKYVPIKATRLQVHIYQPAALDSMEEFAAGDGDGEDGEPVMAATVAELPNKDLDGLWNR